MKINFKNIIYAVAGGILGIMIFIPFSKNIEGADITSNILTTAGGTLNIEQFQLARKYRDRDLLDRDLNSVLQLDNENAIFRMVGSSIFNNFLSFGQTRFDRLFIGYPNRKAYNSPDGIGTNSRSSSGTNSSSGGNPPVNTQANAKLSVDGAITIKSLAHDGSTEVHACVNDFGVIEACDAVAQTTYHWQAGTWSEECSGGGSGTCNGTWTATGTGSCTGTYQDEYCDGGVIRSFQIFPLGSGCYSTIHSCEDSNYQNETSCNSKNGDRCNNNCIWHSNTINCSTLGATNSGDCTASPHESCRWGNGVNATNYCSDKDGTSQGECTGYNSACSWNSGTAGTKTRTVVCKDSSNNTVADSLCTTTKPATEENC